MSLPEARFSTPPPSSSPSPQCDYSEWSPSLVFIPSVYVLVFVLGSLGNGLVLWVYLDRPRGRVARVSSCSKSSKPKTACSGPSTPSSSRSITDSLIASLAAADLAFVLTLPLWAAYTALGYHWPFGKPLCQVSSFIVALNMYASVFSLTGLSVERYWVIARRRKTGAMRGTELCRAPVVVSVVWLAAGVLALPALLLMTVKQVGLGSESDDEWPEEEDAGLPQDSALAFISSCDMDYSSLIPAELEPEERERLEVAWGAALGLKSTLLGFLLPLAVLLLCYCSLGRLLAQHFRESPRPDRGRQRRLLRVIVTLVLAFFLCWLPYHANKSLAMLMELELLPYSCPLVQLLLLAHPYTICLGYVNSCLNPLLYACCDTAFRRRCRALLKNIGCRSRCSRVTEEVLCNSQGLFLTLLCP
ncbi:apelin receptor 2 [Alosa alosa]|uniref:apelin receptor 2 n=1 Tax=Alosa alosa TaxID=278164 RepID=UPI00201504B1|nr:apelin receptor 2 [Alosa alosa]